MIIKRLWLTDFRNHRATDIELDPDITLVVGLNGHGKTNLVEGLFLLSGARSFRGAKVDALVASGQSSAYIRAEVDHNGRSVLVELELAAGGRSRAQINRQRVQRFKDLGDVVRTVIFSPDDLELLKGSPAMRRGLVDDVLASIDSQFRAVRTDFDHILRQRNNLLKQGRGRLTPELEANLDIWNEQFIEVSNEIGRCRSNFVEKIEPIVADFYLRVAGTDDQVSLALDANWREHGLEKTLSETQAEEIRRGVTLVGPHRDDLIILLSQLHSRTQASQGEQRSLALALRLATHAHIAQTCGDSPLVLLDDVFSELDEGRARRLVECLPDAQIVLTSATGTVPDGVKPGLTLEILEGKINGV
ncbi:MAG TPA: DNA replication/repair protein RecF [Acidimicrobiales bacterium]|nr:DNA replication/repair protein RecF [Acidimicrobiales bacterium]